MRRRDALAAMLALGAAGVAGGASAQARKPGKPYRIGFAYKLWPEARVPIAANLREHGWEEARDYTFVDSDVERQDLIDDAVRSALSKVPDILCVISTAHAVAAYRQTKTLPIVMITSGYPVEAGVAENLARPGRNVTGNSAYAGTGIWAKLVQLLREAKPGVKRVGVLWGYVPPLFPKEEIAPLDAEFAQAEASLGVTVHRIDVARPDQVAGALAAMEAARAEALVVTSGPALRNAKQQVLQFAEARRLPTVSDFEQLPEDKGLRPLLVYAPPLDDLRRRAFGYVVRILRDGAKPGELPIQQPAKFELIVNLRAAAAIDLRLPQSLLIRADRVIE
jgi:putative ABC transport system substrate-binding protein